ncbi:MAG: bifunctional demethylmenaquinone methyltransferase/2-methoxy-6-polyprenyl-1,4-benzoquinol methylase UbiE [Porticoccaceae bacterium]
MNEEKTTHFGFEQVATGQKSSRVAEVFDSVAAKYDVMNDLMSGGLHRIWKQVTVEMAAVRPGHRVLDIAGGTGDLAAKFARKVGPQGQVILADINESMLKVGRDRMLNRGVTGNIAYSLADAEQLPFPDNTFDCITIAFGLRNVTDKARALRSMQACLKPGGRLLVLEFSKPGNPVLEKVYDQYSFHLLPRIGKIITGDADSYRYLAESIRMHPDQGTLQTMMEDAGFSQCQYHNMTGGIVALHKGVKSTQTGTQQDIKEDTQNSAQGKKDPQV